MAWTSQIRIDRYCCELCGYVIAEGNSSCGDRLDIERRINLTEFSTSSNIEALTEELVKM
jgi:hypothetical protein